MRLLSSDPEAEKIKSVRVDGKKVVTWVELDTDEGWVMAEVPNLPAKRHIYEEGEEVQVSDEDLGEGIRDASTFGWKNIKHTGNVEITFNDS